MVSNFGGSFIFISPTVSPPLTPSWPPPLWMGLSECLTLFAARRNSFSEVRTSEDLLSFCCYYFHPHPTSLEGSMRISQCFDMLPPPSGHGADVMSVDWHPRKGLLASGSKDNQQPVKLWDPKSGQSVATL